MTPYRLDISYIAGNINTVADYFSRPLIASVSSPTLISNISITPSNVNTSSIVSTYDIDPFFAPLQAHPLQDTGFIDPKTNLLYKEPSRLCAPISCYQQLLDSYHSSLFGWHAGITRLSKKLKSYFYFPRMYERIINYVANWEICQRVNSNCHAGSLQKPAASPGRWEEIFVDIFSFFFSATQRRGHAVTAVLVIVDRFSSHCHFTRLQPTFCRRLCQFIIFQYMPHHGIHEVIHTDRGRQFENNLVKAFTGNVHSTLSFNITAHHQSNDKAERYIRTLQDDLRAYADASISWVELLPYAKFTTNLTPSVSLGGRSPFCTDLGYNPSLLISLTYSLS